MQGAGNDFVIVDRRGAQEPLPAALIPRLADRHFGVGCDQVITVEPPRSAAALASYAIWNSDGSAAMQCGNGARCVAAWLRREGSAPGDTFVLDSPAGPVEVRCPGAGAIEVALGVPDFDPARIGLRDAAASDPYWLDFAGERIYFGAVSMGNPHAVLEVASASDTHVARVAAMLQAHPFFREGCNVGFAQILAPDHVRLRVVERGAGETLACGSGACAAVAVLARRGRVGRNVRVDLPGGTLLIRWPTEAAPVSMSGPAEFVFEGELPV
jgi:diaminopimelate epimerase